MTLKIGTIEADIGADTSGLKTAESEVTKSTTKINKQLKVVEKSAIRTGTKGFRSLGRNAGQAGIQVQQLVGQIQGGQSAFVALSQQSADLGFVLGAPLVGVVVSLAAVLGGVLWQAFNDNADAAERAATSAADLNKEYLKLTEQTQALKAATLQEDMLRDAAAIVELSKEMRELKDARDELIFQGTQGINISEGMIKEYDKLINGVDNRLQLLIQMNESRASQIAEVFKELTGQDVDLSTQMPGDAMSFDQIMQQEIATLELRASLFGDSNAKIEAEILRHQLAALNLFEAGSDDFLAAEQALADKRIELKAAANEKIEAQQAASDKRIAAQQTAVQATTLNTMATLGDNINQVIEASGKEGTAIAKAVFLANKAIQVAQIIASTQVGAAQALALGPAGIPIAGLIEGMGFASAGIVAGLSVGEAFENGGIVGGSSFSGDRVPARVNSGEMILNKGQQSRLFNMANGSQSGGQANVTIVSNGTPQTVTSTQMSRGEIAIMINDANRSTERKINGSLASGRGDTYNSLQQGSKVQRKLT